MEQVKKQILVTGAHGQLGTAIKKISPQNPGYSFLFHDKDTLDLSDFDKLKKYILKEKPAYIINCAAYTAVDKAESDKENVFLLNTEIPGKLALFASQAGAKLFHISTDYVFDGKTYKPYSENQAVSPVSIYGKSKAMGEQAVLDNGNHYVIRTSWLYSATGNNFLKTVIRLAAERDKLTMIFDQVSTPTYASDLAQAVLHMIHSIKKHSSEEPEIFHYANEGVCSWYDFAKAIVDETGASCTILPIETHEYPLPAKRPFYSVLNKSKIKRKFDIEVPYWRDSLKKCIHELK